MKLAKLYFHCSLKTTFRSCFQWFYCVSSQVSWNMTTLSATARRHEVEEKFSKKLKSLNENLENFQAEQTLSTSTLILWTSIKLAKKIIILQWWNDDGTAAEHKRWWITTFSPSSQALSLARSCCESANDIAWQQKLYQQKKNPSSDEKNPHYQCLAMMKIYF